MSFEWPRSSLREFVDLLAGFAFKSRGYTDVSEDVRLLRGDNIAPGKVRWDGVKRWPKDGGADLSKYVLEPGDVVLAMDRPWIPAGLKIAQVTKTDTPSYLVQRVARLRAASRFDCDFLFALLSVPDFDSYIQNATTGTAVPHISAKQILDYEFRLPPATVRAEIGTLVAEVNDRITLLRETNATLEAIAQALFKSWFVDFDPVRAKMAGHPPEGMDAATAALFPDTLEETELGLVPKGWRFGTIGDFAQLKRGSVNPGRQPDVVFEHYSLPAFDNERCPVVELGEAIKSNKTPVSSDAVLLSKLNPHIPRIWMPVHCGINAICSTEFLVFQPVGVGSKELIYCTFSSPDFLVRLQHLVTGTSNSHQRIKPDQVALMSSIVPPKEIARQFEVLMKPIFEKVHANGEQARSLASLRDTLLPRLISGQLRLPEAPTQQEAAA